MSVSVTEGDFTVESSHESEAEIRQALGVEVPVKPAGDEPPVEEPEPNPDLEPEPELVAKPEKIDGRTRQGKALSIQAQIDQQTARKHAAKAEADAEEARLAALRAERATVSSQPRREVPPSPTPSGFAEPEPTIEQFKDQADPYTSWIRALGRWESRKEFSELTQRQQHEQARARQQQTIDGAKQTYRERMTAAGAATPEFFQSMPPQLANLRPSFELQQGEERTVWNAIADEIVTSEHPAAVMTHLKNHPTELQRLATLNPHQLVRAIGKIEVHVEAALSGPAHVPAISHAKPPIKPVGSSPDVSADDSDDAEELSEAAILRHHKRGNAADPRFARAASR